MQSLRKDSYLLTLIKECLEVLEGNVWFSTLELASGYWQVAMEESSLRETAFLMHDDLY
jgi:hypothetical protein